MSRELLRTTCNRDCPDTCGLVVTVEDGRATKIDGDPQHAVTDGFICFRTSRFLDRQYSSDRITTPLIRRDGHFDPIGWEEAIDFAARRLLQIREESGPAAIFHYRSGGSLGILKSVVDYFFELFGPVTVKRGDICSGAGDAAQETDFGDEESHDFFDILNSRNILLWGKNATVSNIHLVPLLKRAREAGAELILIDPISHQTRNYCQQKIQPRPGGDAALAMAVAARLFESGRIDAEAQSYCDNFEPFRALAVSRGVAGWARDADVSVEEVEAVAAALAGRPCSIQVGWGMGRRMNGSAIVRALDALGAISGNIGIPGGGVSFYYRRRRAFDTTFLQKTEARSLVEPLLGREIAAASSPPIRAMWITCANPVAMIPDSSAVASAIESRELVVAVDTHFNDTVRRATLVFPTTTLLESDDLIGAYGHHWLGASRPVVTPPHGVKSDIEIVQAIAARIDELTGAGPDGIAPRLAGSAREWKRRILKRVEPRGVTVEALEAGAKRNPLVANVLWPDHRFPTKSGRMQLLTELPAEPPEEPGFSLWLFSNSTEKAQCSQWAGPIPEVITARCHPEAAAGFADGDTVWIESAIGRLRARLKLDPSQRKDTILVPKGGSFDNGTCANALIRARTTDAGEGAAYLDCRVRIRRIDG